MSISVKEKLIIEIVCVLVFVIVIVGIIMWKDRQGKIIMVTEAGFAPYEFYNGQEIVGVDIEIAKAIAEELGKELVIVDTEFTSVLDKVKSGRADFAAAGLSITKERLEEVDFSIEYAVSKQVIVVKKDSEIRSIEDLSGKKVSVQLGTVADIVLGEEYPEVKLVKRKRYSLAVKDVLMDTSSALVIDSLPAEDIIRRNPELKILKPELFICRYGIAVKKGNTELLETINSVLERLIAEGKIEEYTREYIEY